MFSAKNIVLLTEINGFFDASLLHNYMDVINTGYGPGPFDNPSEEAIKAVLEPAENDYYYFVADTSTGNVYFAKTYEEHMELVEKYVNNS